MSSILELLKAHPEWKSAKWRLNNLYWIKDKNGQKVKLQFNWAQQDLYEEMWYLNIILKARQLGMTTFIQIFMLDRCLFNDNVNAGVIAHNREDAESFFDDKIKFAYDALPQEIRDARPAQNDSARELSFSNGSKIRVGTSMRSGTLQYLHISEFGKICAKYPDRAKEIIAGALNTVAQGQFVFIESTAEGDGPFKTMFNTAYHAETEPSLLEYKAFFYPWFRHPDYVLEGIVVDSDEREREYFKTLYEQEGIVLSQEQKNWYLLKWREQGDLMKQEYPSTPAEAFNKLLEGVILQREINTMRKEGRICRLPRLRAPVNTFWDLGRSDKTGIWFHQQDGAWHNFIKYYEYSLADLSWYAARLADFARENDWVYGTHYLPHDGNNTDISATESRREILERLGVRPIRIVPRVTDLNAGIELLRGSFSTYRIDETECAEGIAHIENYRYQQDKHPDAMGNPVFRRIPLKNGADHCVDALRQHAQGYRGAESSWKAQLEGRTGTGRRGSTIHNPLTNPTFEHVL